MSASFAMPAAVRLRRTAAAGRALLVVLFLGGFLTLAFLFGGHAHAAETPSPDAGTHALTVSKSGKAAGRRLGASLRNDLGGHRECRDAAPYCAPGRKSVGGVSQAAHRDVRRTDAALHKAAEVLKPVIDVTGRVARPVGGVAEVVTGLPEKLSAGPSTPAATEPVHGSGQAATAAPGGVRAGKLGPEAAPSAFRASGTGSWRPAHPAHAASPTGDEGAARPAPFDDPRPPSVPASQFTSGNSSPRGADRYATLPSDRTGRALTAGAVSTATVAPTYERSGDVLEFPA